MPDQMADDLRENPFAAPEGPEPAEPVRKYRNTQAWRDGEWLVARETLVLTDHCIRCGEPASSRVRQQVSWHGPFIYLTLLLGLIPYFIIAAFSKYRASIHVGLCDAHASERFGLKLLYWTAVAVSVPMMMGALASDIPQLILAALVFMLAAGIAISRGLPLLSPRSQTGRDLWFKGADRGFLATLPDFHTRKE